MVTFDTPDFQLCLAWKELDGIASRQGSPSKGARNYLATTPGGEKAVNIQKGLSSWLCR
jgi:DNA-binding HxlR family transcriptional regulator